MHVHDVSALDVAQHRGCNRIATGTPIWEPHHVDAFDIFTCGQNEVWPCKVAIECDDPHLVAATKLGPRKIVNNIFQSTNRRGELPGHMRDPHWLSGTCVTVLGCGIRVK